MKTFRKVKFEMIRGGGYGQYFIISRYRGKKIKAHTTDSEAFDHLDDDGIKGIDARRHCYNKIVETYKNK